LLAEISHRSHAVPIDRFPVVVGTIVDEDATAVEVVAKGVENREAFCSLSHDELRKHLPTEFHNSAALDRDGEATFAIDESNNPADGFQPFLLIVCTHHVVTALRRVV